MDRLIRSSRWAFTLAVLIMIRSFSDYKSLIVFPFLFMLIYLIFLEIALYKHSPNRTIRFVLAVVDIFFLAWAQYVFNSDLFLIFYFIMILIARVEFNRKGLLILLLLAGVSYLLVFIFHYNAKTDSLGFVLTTLVIKPGGLIVALYSAEKIRALTQKEILQENEELSKRIESKNELLSTLSHELRTPLTMIKAASDILLEGRPGSINNMQSTFLNTISSNTRRLIELVENILVRIKIESTWLKLNLQEIDIRLVVKRIVQNMMPLVRQRNQNLRYDYPHILSRVLADENWIQQVIINLIHNASKYTGENGSIFISIKENEECIVISVSDDGRGIASAQKTQVFHRYYQENGFHEDHADGVGLGLAIVKHVVEKHNGKVYVGSVPGMGSTFSFTLPIYRRYSA
ncbi:MAG: HAMP domain-containing sensor histidine kinase [Spirochaetota bacterium]